MKIKEICNYACALLGRSDIAEYLEKGSAENLSEITNEVEVLVRLSNLVISELAVSYVPFLTTETVNTSNGNIEFDMLKQKALEVISVKTPDGKEATFVEYPSKIKTVTGRVEITYTYLPTDYSLEEEFNFPDNRITPSLIAQAVAGEYYLVEGFLEKAQAFFENYTNKTPEIRI